MPRGVARNAGSAGHTCGACWPPAKPNFMSCSLRTPAGNRPTEPGPALRRRGRRRPGGRVLRIPGLGIGFPLVRTAVTRWRCSKASGWAGSEARSSAAHLERFRHWAGTLLRGSDIAQLLKEVAGAAAELLEAESGGGFAVSDAA